MSVADIPFRKKLALNLFKKYKQNESKLHKLNYILWECTLRCNLNCLHCGSDCKKDASIKDMPGEDFIRAIDEIKDIVDSKNTTIVFSGGEPLLRKDLEKIGQELYNRSFPWGIVTNAMLLTPQRLSTLIAAGLRTITISLDGLESSHNWLRGNKNSFNNAFSAIKLLTEVPELTYDVVTCVTRKNFAELEELRDKLIFHHVKAWRLFTIFPIGRARDIEELQLTNQEFKSLFDFIAQTRKTGLIKLNYGCEGFLGDYEKEVRDNFFFCRAGINVASIMADGSISACTSLRSNFKQGNIYKDNFSEVWQNKFQVFRDRSWTKTGKCAECDFYKYCEGNGMHLRDEKSGELLFCHLHRILEAE